MVLTVFTVNSKVFISVVKRGKLRRNSCINRSILIVSVILDFDSNYDSNSNSDSDFDSDSVIASPIQLYYYIVLDFNFRFSPRSSVE